MSITEFSPGIARMPVSIANVYFLGAPGSPWFLVDSGTPGYTQKLIEAAEGRYGKGTKPEYIVLTHGHFDHSGSACELAERWQVPIYAHYLETPYLTGASAYPPKDPTVGGAMAFLSRFFPKKSAKLQPHLRPLPADGEVPGHPEWRWIFTPGHAPGHVSLYDSARRVLLSGDAIASADLDSVTGIISQKPQISRPPAPMNYDWVAARESVQSLAKLEPYAVGCGHGQPMSGSEVAVELHDLAVNFPMPERGRYVPNPARTDEHGVQYVPPEPPDPLPNLAAALGIAVALGAILLFKIEVDKHTGDQELD